MSYIDSILGAAIFDLNGLPKKYFTTAESTSMSWVQAIFQALGLQSLLISSLQLEGFNHATIRGKDYCAVVVKQRTSYVALLLVEPFREPPDHQFIQWARTLNPNDLSQHPRFEVA